MARSGRPIRRPAWPARTRFANRWTGRDTGWQPVNVDCVLPECEKPTSSYFCSEEHLALYRARWPDDRQLRLHGVKFVAGAGREVRDRLEALYGKQPGRSTTEVVTDARGSYVVDEDPLRGFCDRRHPDALRALRD